jgi:GTP-binding protein HflX
MKTRTPPKTSTEKAILVQLIWGDATREQAADSLAELENLADTAGITVAGSITQRRERPTGQYYIGEGKVQEVGMACEKSGANLILFDNELSPIQVNNLDLTLGVKVLDRTELILQIFARRARSAEASIQVELAQLQYLVSRLPTSIKQARFGGGIGMRGPGESPLQLRNAPMRRRISELKAKLRLIQKRRVDQRQRAWPQISVVGYTNVGKSTLLNALTSAEAYVDDRLFATLDTKSRLLYLPSGRQVMLTDTVGFIRNLPHGLVASFRSTLEEAAQADLLLHVADAGHPFITEHCTVVFDTLREIHADQVPTLLVLNKCDRPAALEALPRLRTLFPDALAISAASGEGIPELKQRIAERIGPAASSTPETSPTDAHDPASS